MKKIDVFNNYYSQTKEEIIEEFKSHYRYYKENNDGELSEQYRNKYLKLCEKFLEGLEKIKLPQLTDNWWCYCYTIKSDSINLELSFCEELELGEDYEVESATFSENYILFSSKCDYLSVSEYAELYNVSEITVRQWIRRGKIRSAKKEGRDWLIPDVADKPSRGFNSVSYMWKELPNSILERFPFLSTYDNIFIFQDEYDKGIFNIVLNNSNKNRREKIQISNQKREKLELELISSGIVEVEEIRIFHT